jgi:hypothetical protein
VRVDADDAEVGDAEGGGMDLGDLSPGNRKTKI